MLSSDVRQLIIDWLDDNYHFGEAQTLIKDDEMSFLDNKILTSLGFVELILYLEDTLGMAIERSQLTRENFDGLGKIIRFVEALKVGHH